MLGCGHERRLIAELWELTEAKVQLPYPLSSEFLNSQGPASTYYDDKRSFQRYFMRAKAVLKRRGSKLGAFTKDVSRRGIGFLSPVPLLPREKVELTLASANLKLEISRCRRVDKGCFDCGGNFAL